MPQQIHVVQCYKCHTYQSDIVKKVNKWSCKMCGEKQSLKNVYGIGSGKECRLIVQKLSEKTMQADFMTSHIVEDILGTVQIQEESNSKIKFEPDSCVNEKASTFSNLLEDFTEIEEDTLPQTSLTPSVQTNFYTKPERKSSSSSCSTKYNPYTTSNNNSYGNRRQLPKLVGYHNKEGSQSSVKKVQEDSNSNIKTEKKTKPYSCVNERGSTWYNNKKLPNLVGYYNKEGTQSSVKELTKTEPDSCGNERGSTRNNSENDTEKEDTTLPENTSSSSYSMKSTGFMNLPNLVGYHNKESSQSSSKELTSSLVNLKKVELPENSTNTDYWGTDNLNDEELDEILKLDF